MDQTQRVHRGSTVKGKLRNKKKSWSICIPTLALRAHTCQLTAVLRSSWRTRAHGGWWMQPVRPQRRCSAHAPPLKSGGAARGDHSEGCVWARDTEKFQSDLSGSSITMANTAQQPPHLHLAEVTASQFLDIWKHFDVDGKSLDSWKLTPNYSSTASKNPRKWWNDVT